MKNDKVDERVVKLELDNSDFEQKSKESMKTIDKLDKKLKFEDVEDSIKKIEFQFSKMEIVAIAAISNITNRVINLGIQVVKSLSVDNISAGWSKFGDKATSVATMAAQAIRVAGKELTTQEEKLEAINEQLERLNWFTDETSYSFTDMVSNIGKFTAAGVDLDKSVDAMMGIANWAALSGQNAATASRAMYQLAQALGKGSVQLIDYRSIQNANMDTQEFRQTVLDTAAAMGELTKEGNNFITKTGKKFTKNQFAEFLSEKWFTSDVLVQSLGKYSAAIEKIYEISQETGMTASEVISRYGDELDKFGLKAFKAAQEARTFTDVLNSIKDAVSTGWMKVAEKMFGGYEESVKTWTELANRLYDVFTEQVFYIEDVLKAAEKLDFREDLFKIVDSEELKEEQGALWNIIDAIEYLSDTIKSAWNTIFPKSQFEEYNDQVNEVGSSVKRLAETFRKYTLQLANTIKNSETLKSLFTGIFGILGGLIYVLKAIRFIIDPILYSVKEVITLVYTKLSDIVGDTSKLASFIGVLESAAMRLNKTIQSLMEIINPAGLLNRLYNYIVDLFDAINETKPLETLAGWINNIYSAIEKFLIDDGVLEGILNSVISLISVLGKAIIGVVKILNKTVIPLGKKLVEIGEKLVEIILDIVSSIVDLTTTAATNISGLFSDIFGEFNPVGVLSSLSNFLTGIIDSFENFKKKIADLDFDDNKDGNPLVDLVIGLIKLIEGAINLLSPMISILARILAGIGSLLTKVGEMLQDFFDHVTGVAEAAASLTTIIISGAIIITALKFTLWIIETLRVWMNPLASLLHSLADVCDGIWSFLNKKGLAVLIKSIGDALLEISVAILLISYIDWKKAWPGVVALGGIAALIMAFTVIVTKISKVTISTGKKITGLKDGLFSLMSAMRDVIKGVSKNLVFLSLGKLVKSIATSMILLSAAFLLMSKLDWESVKKGLAIMAAYFGGFIATYATIMLLSKKVKKGTNIKKLVGSFWTFSGVALAILSISKAITRMATIADDKKMWSAIGGIVAVIIALVGSLTLLNKFSSNGSRTVLASAAELTALSIALGLMIAPILILGALPVDTVWKGFAVIAALTALVVTATTLMTKFASTNSTFTSKIQTGINSSLDVSHKLEDFNSASKTMTKSLSSKSSTKSSKKLKDSAKSTNSESISIGENIEAIDKNNDSMHILAGAYDKASSETEGLTAGINTYSGAAGILQGSTNQNETIKKGIIAGAKQSSRSSLDVSNNFDLSASASETMRKSVKEAGKSVSKTAEDISEDSSAMTKFNEEAGLVAKQFDGTTSTFKNTKKSMLPAILALVAMSVALLAFTAAIAILGAFSWEHLGKGLVGVAALLAMFAGVMVALKYASKGMNFKKGLSILLESVGIVSALVAFAIVCSALGALPILMGVKGLISISLLLLAFTLTIKAINKMKKVIDWKAGISVLLQCIGMSIAIISFAGAMAILGVVFTAFPTSQLWKVAVAFTTIVAIMAAVTAAIYFINKGVSSSDISTGVSIILQLVGLSAALLAFAATMWILALFPWNTIWYVPLVLVGVMAAFMGALIGINRLAGAPQKSTSVLLQLIGLSAALLVFAASMWILAIYPWNTMWYVPLVLVGVMAALMGVVIGINKLSGEANDSKKSLFILIGLSVALIGFATSMLILTTIPWQKLLITLGILSGVILVMGVAIGLLNKLSATSDKSKKSASNLSNSFKELSGMSIALVSFAVSMLILSNIPWQKLLISFGILTATFYALSFAMIIISRLSGDANNVKGSIISLIGISASLLVFAGAMLMMSSISWETILVSTLAMVLVIGAIIGALFAINAIGEDGPTSLILLAGALMVLSLSMIAFGVATSLLGSTGMKNVAKALLVMCAALAVLATVAFIISKAGVDMVLTTLAIAIILVGIGMLATALAMGEFNEHFVEILNNIKDNAPLIGEAFSAMLQAARQALPDLFALIGDFVSGILQLIRDKTPEFFETVKVLVHGVLDLIRDVAPDLIYTVAYLINCLADNADYILTGLFRILIIFLDKLATYIPVIVNRLVEILARLTIALADSLMTLFYAIEYLTVKLFELLLRALPTVWDQCTQWMPDGLRTVLGWIFGFEELRWLADRVGGLANNVKRDLENEMANNHIDLAEVFGVDGQNAADGYAQGIAENSDKSIEAAAGMAEGAQEAIAEAQDSHSPSKKTYELGLYAVEGYAEGVEENTALVKEAIENMVITSLADIQSILDAEMDENPIVIRPVLDLSGIQGQASSIQSIMGTVGNVDVASSTAETVSRSMPNKASGVNEVSKNQNGPTTNNNYSDSYNVTFNVTSDDPEEIAKQVDEQLQKMRINRRLAKGGV